MLTLRGGAVLSCDENCYASAVYCLLECLSLLTTVRGSRRKFEEWTFGKPKEG